MYINLYFTEREMLRRGKLAGWGDSQTARWQMLAEQAWDPSSVLSTHLKRQVSCRVLELSAEEEETGGTCELDGCLGQPNQ